jgi:hypothetical protein
MNAEKNGVPMCDNSNFKKCCSCGKVGDDVTYEPDPFYDEIFGNDTPVWECADCRYESTMEI